MEMLEFLKHVHNLVALYRASQSKNTDYIRLYKKVLCIVSLPRVLFVS